MKAKTIKAVLRKVHSDWVDSIDDKELCALVRKNTIITGGCIASMLLREPVNDYDIYFTDQRTVIRACEYYINKFYKLNPESKTQLRIDVTNDRVKIKLDTRDLRPAHEPGYQFDEQPVDYDDPETKEPAVVDDSKAKLPMYRPVYISANAITLSNKIQLVIRFYGPAETIHENYDYEHCKCHWTSDHGTLVLPASALEALITKELVYTGSKYPLASIIRSRKFIQRGFTINAGQYLKMCMQLNEFDLTDLFTLEDQLIGMDAVYFAALLAAIPEDKRIDNKVNIHYIMTLINRFF